MGEWNCNRCGNESEGDIPDFGDDAICEKCGAVHETDWDYTDPYGGSYSSWIVGLKEKEDAR